MCADRQVSRIHSGIADSTFRRWQKVLLAAMMYLNAACVHEKVAIADSVPLGYFECPLYGGIWR